jgi:hypothetical protein
MFIVLYSQTRILYRSDLLPLKVKIMSAGGAFFVDDNDEYTFFILSVIFGEYFFVGLKNTF